MSRDKSITQCIKEDRALLFAGIENNACQCFPCSTADERCMCPQNEWALRCYIHGESIRPMTVPEREWCLDEIGQVEGYERAEHENDSDADLANTVLRAWVDYCRDKGLL